MAAERKYDINKIINQGTYRPLRFKENGNERKYDFNRELYCEVFKIEAENNYSARTKADFLADFAEVVSGKYDSIVDDEKRIVKDKEKRRKYMSRIHNRILLGNNSGTSTVASDKTCYCFLRQVEDRFKKSILTEIIDKTPFYYENKYIYTQVVQLMEIMFASDIFNYVPNSNNFQYNCYRNHLQMIEHNIQYIFENESSLYD